MVTKVSALAEKVIGVRPPISSLTIFAHYPDEFEYMKGAILALGTLRDANNGPRVLLSTPMQVADNLIQCVRIRHPDPYRSQVGCGDLVVRDYQEFKKQYLRERSHHLRLIERERYEMIEFFDPDYDVFAYVVSN
ncbi:MAG: hypothetical protein Q7R80_05150 [bacterium]|nr:hypothetical protein [bacterium]